MISSLKGLEGLWGGIWNESKIIEKWEERNDRNIIILCLCLFNLIRNIKLLIIKKL